MKKNKLLFLAIIITTAYTDPIFAGYRQVIDYRSQTLQDFAKIHLPNDLRPSEKEALKRRITVLLDNPDSSLDKALICAAQAASAPMVKQLLQMGANPTKVVDETTAKQETEKALKQAKIDIPTKKNIFTTCLAGFALEKHDPGFVQQMRYQCAMLYNTYYKKHEQVAASEAILKLFKQHSAT